MGWQRGTRLLLCVALAALTALAAAQDRRRQNQEELPEPQAVDFVTADGVIIAGTYYPSTAGKNATPVLLLHMFGGDHNQWHLLCETLQQLEFAVLAFDFRGHGASTKYDPNVVPPQLARRRPLNLRQFRNAEQLSQMLQDVEAAKKFLIARHNQGELNIAKLCVVGAEFGATIGTLWAQYDWSYAPVGTVKVGQDVRALVLLSPVLNYRGLRINTAIQELQLALPFMIAYGARDKRFRQQAERVWRLIRPTTPGGQFSQLVPLDTKLQGTHLLNPELRFNLDKRIGQFLVRVSRELRVPWEPRGDRED